MQAPFFEDWRIINVKEGLPTVEQARKRLLDEITRARIDGVRALIIIHGYGSTGVGGKIKIGLSKTLRNLQKAGSIREFIPGESWAESNPQARRLIQACPSLSVDPDLNRRNPGISLALL